MSYSQETIEFAKLVKAMRDYQREYFRTRNSSMLSCSKTAERMVDKQVRIILDSEQRIV